EALLRERDVLWNSGIFAWRVDVILAALRTHLPGLVERLSGVSGARLAASYRRLPPVSIDQGVLERAEGVAVVRARFRWSDVGSLAAVASLSSGGNGRDVVRARSLA